MLSAGDDVETETVDEADIKMRRNREPAVNIPKMDNSKRNKNWNNNKSHQMGNQG